MVNNLLIPPLIQKVYVQYTNLIVVVPESTHKVGTKFLIIKIKVYQSALESVLIIYRLGF